MTLENNDTVITVSTSMVYLPPYSNTVPQYWPGLALLCLLHACSKMNGYKRGTWKSWQVS